MRQAREQQILQHIRVVAREVLVNLAVGVVAPGLAFSRKSPLLKTPSGEASRVSSARSFIEPSSCPLTEAQRERPCLMGRTLRNVPAFARALGDTARFSTRRPRGMSFRVLVMTSLLLLVPAGTFASSEDPGPRRGRRVRCPHRSFLLFFKKPTRRCSIKSLTRVSPIPSQSHRTFSRVRGP